MNTNQLKRFAKEASIKLLDQVGRKLEFVQNNTRQSFLDSYPTQIKSLKDKIQQIGKEQAVEIVAYTWFNRFMALRFMDANGYTVPKVVTPLQGMTNPEILQNALGGNIEPELKLDRKRINDLLDGKTAVADAHTETYKILLIASCNQWHTAMPFMFEPISDYTELLLPDDLLSDYSIVADIRNGMSEEDCQQEELIGWLYQFYISDKKDKVINAKKKYKTEELPEATQLFTPNWMVKYMVENTLGRMWLEARPNSNLKEHMEFYIEPNDKANIPFRKINSPEEITFLDPASGSAHILVYAFQLFTRIYEEEGYNTTDIPNIILDKNLFGLEIDDRAASIGSFALTMKATAYRKRYLRKPIVPKIYVFEETDEVSNFKNAKALGSLIRINKNDFEKIKVDEDSIFSVKQKQYKEFAQVLSMKYDCVVTNPPYVNAAYMNEVLADYVKANYKETKSDLFACFLKRSREFAKPDGMIGIVCPFVWMFISSYKWLRNHIIKETTIQNLIQLEYNAFEPACVPICTFTLRNEFTNQKGNYIKLSDFRGHENQPIKTLEAIQNPDCGWYYPADQKDFEKIPGSPIGYWLSKKVISIFSEFPKLSTLASPRKGNSTSDNNKFLRFWPEVNFSKVGLNFESVNCFLNENKKWLPYNKGGGLRKWYGYNEFLVNWENNGKAIREIPSAVVTNEKYYMKPGLTWSTISSKAFGVRYFNEGYIFDNGGCCLFDIEKNRDYLAGLMNSKVFTLLLGQINPTLNFQSGEVSKFPIIEKNIGYISSRANYNLSKEEWDSRETSWDFQQNELIRQQKKSLESAFDEYKTYWSAKFYELHSNEEELNRQFIEIYSLQDELKPDVPLEEITILKEEAKIIDNQLVIQAVTVLLQLLSYSIGCIFGRYSLDKFGLILANEGETLQDYLRIVDRCSLSVVSEEAPTTNNYQLPTKHYQPTTKFMPDEDNIIPVLEGEWFNDDIVGRFKMFLKAAFGEEHFEENLKFIEDTIGKDIRKYFVKDFYNDHIKRYKKRPIYWMFSSPKGHFKALIYMHRYQPDLCSKLLNDYLQAFISKLEAKKQSETMLSLREDISAREKTLAIKEIDKSEAMLKDCREYGKTLFAIATQKISIDLDDGVKVNYQKFKDILVPIKGLEKEEE